MKKKNALLGIALACMLSMTACGNKVEDYSDKKKTTEAVTEATTEASTEAKTEEESTDVDARNDNATAKKSEEVDTDAYKEIAGKTFKVVASKYALEWQDEFTVKDDGSFTATYTIYTETEEVTNYSGQLEKLSYGTDKVYTTKVAKSDMQTCIGNGFELTFFDKGFQVSKLPEDMVECLKRTTKYGYILDLDTLPCMMMLNKDDNSTYADASYVPDELTEEPATSDMNSPFYGVWVYGSKDKADADNFAANVNGMTSLVFLTTDWSNLNTEPYYVVSLGMYTTEDDANGALETAKGLGYSDAYVKYSGEHN